MTAMIQSGLTNRFPCNFPLPTNLWPVPVAGRSEAVLGSIEALYPFSSSVRVRVAEEGVKGRRFGFVRNARNGEAHSS